VDLAPITVTFLPSPSVPLPPSPSLPLPPSPSLSLSLSLSPVISYYFFMNFSCDLYCRMWGIHECTRRTHNRPGRALILSEILFKEVAILNRVSQGRLRNPARHCEDGNQFSSRGSFSRYFHHRASTKHEGGACNVCVHRALACARMQALSLIRIVTPCLLSTPFSPWFLRFVPSFDACVYCKR
jgi:hypothetical protein